MPIPGIKLRDFLGRTGTKISKGIMSFFARFREIRKKVPKLTPLHAQEHRYAFPKYVPISLNEVPNCEFMGIVKRCHNEWYLQGTPKLDPLPGAGHRHAAPKGVSKKS